MRNAGENIFIIVICILVITACTPLRPTGYVASIPSDTALFTTIYNQDSILFSAFNSRDFGKFKSFFSEKLEIYQDNVGVRNYEQSMEAFQGLFNGEYILTRELRKETLEVYPIKNFGAIETGQHTFSHIENGRPDTGTFKFVHIWEFQQGSWKITRIITYGH